MVKFGQYWESMVQTKPEWRRAYVDYPRLNGLTSQLKRELKARMRLASGGVHEEDVFPNALDTEAQQADKRRQEQDDDDAEDTLYASARRDPSSMRLTPVRSTDALATMSTGGVRPGTPRDLMPASTPSAPGPPTADFPRRNDGPIAGSELRTVSVASTRGMDSPLLARDSDPVMMNPQHSQSPQLTPHASGTYSPPRPHMERRGEDSVDDDHLRHTSTLERGSDSMTRPAPVNGNGSLHRRSARSDTPAFAPPQQFVKRHHERKTSLLGVSSTSPPQSPTRGPVRGHFPSTLSDGQRPTPEHTSLQHGDETPIGSSANADTSVAMSPAHLPSPARPAHVGPPTAADTACDVTAPPREQATTARPSMIECGLHRVSTHALLEGAAVSDCASGLCVPVPGSVHEGNGPAAPGTDHVIAGDEFEFALTHHGQELAQDVERLLAQEVDKASTFAENSVERFQQYNEDHRAAWLSLKDKKRSRQSMQHLYAEVDQMHTFCDTNILAIKTVLKKYANTQPHGVGPTANEDYLIPRMFAVTKDVEALRLSLEVLSSELFADGDVHRAKNELRGELTTHKMPPSQAFRSGVFAALIFACILYFLHVFFELSPSHDAMLDFYRLFPVIRLFISLAFAFVVWSWVLWVFMRQRINYLYVFDLPMTATMTWLQCAEHSLGMMFLVLFAAVLYLRSELSRHTDLYSSAAGFPAVSPYIWPALMIAFIGLCAFPPRHVMRRTRNAFFRVFRRLVVLPIGYVRFVEFFVADWGTSMVDPCQDLLYTACYFAYTPNQPSINSSKWGMCPDVRAKWSFPVAAIPYFWRACQTMKMYLRTDNKAHLVNFGKYTSFLISFIVSWWFALEDKQGVPLHVVAWIAHSIAEFYAFVWDITMDWGFIRGRERERMFKRTWLYVAASIFDFAARFFYVVARVWIAPNLQGHEKEWLILFQALLEIFRRANWSIFRVENENVNNLETYRRIDFVPEITLAEKDE